jgi:hypothetical protein
VGFSGLAYSAKHGAYFAASRSQGSFWKVDTLLRRAQKTSLAQPQAEACAA